MSKPRNTTINAGMNGNAYEAGMRMRQGAYRAEEMHKRKRINPGPAKVIPIWRGLFNIFCGIVLIVVMKNRFDKVPYHIPNIQPDPVIEAQAVEDARNGVHYGITPMSETTRRAAFGIR